MNEVNDASEEKGFIQKYWPYFTIFCAPPLINLAGGQDITRDLTIRFVFIILALLAYFVGTKVVGIHKREELPWYGAPVMWLGIPLLGVMVYEFLF